MKTSNKVKPDEIVEWFKNQSPKVDDEVDLSFPIWYSGMSESKVRAAYKRFLEETGYKTKTI